MYFKNFAVWIMFGHFSTLYVKGLMTSPEAYLEPMTNYFGSSRSQMFFKLAVLKNFTNLTEKHLCWSIFFKKLQALGWRPTQVFFCENCEIFKNNFFNRTPLVTVSVNSLTIAQ